MEKTPEIKTKITAVTIYRDGARVIRTGSIQLKPGTHKLRVSNLTQFLDKESIRVSGHGHATIVSYDAVDTTVETTGFTQLDVLVKKKETLEKQQIRLQRDLGHIDSRLGFYNQILTNSAGEFSKWIPTGESEVERIGTLETLVTKQLDSLHKTRIKIKSDLENVQKQLSLVSREINKFQREVRQYEITNTILLNVEAHQAGKCEFTIKYFVQRAAWTPSYDIDLTEEDANVTMYTVVHNYTQENWDKVHLTVSTASSRPAIITEPTPYLVGVYTPKIAPRRDRAKRRVPMASKPSAAPAAGASDVMTEVALVEEPISPPIMEEVSATILETGGVHVFVLPEPVKVPADGEPHAFRTSQVKLKAEQKFFWNAVDFAEAIEVTVIENGETIILPGKAKLYRGDDFLGETRLPVIAPQEKMEVGTRFTYDLKVEKKLIAKSAEKAGLTRGNVSHEYSYELTVTNFRKKPSPLKVMDRIPHSDSEKIKVQVKKFSLKPTDSKLGIFTWETEIPAETEMKITYVFEVDYPRGLRITPPLP